MLRKNTYTYIEMDLGRETCDATININLFFCVEVIYVMMMIYIYIWYKYETKEEVVVKAKHILQGWKVEGGERREGERVCGCVVGLKNRLSKDNQSMCLQ